MPEREFRSDGNWSATFQPKDGSPAQQGGGTYLTVYVQQPDGSALILRDAFNDLLDDRCGSAWNRKRGAP